MRAIKSEWIKLTSVKSFWIVALFSILTSVGISFLMVAVRNPNFEDLSIEDAFDPTNSTPPFWIHQATGQSFVQIALSVFAILAITNEYSSQTISTSLLVTPKRNVLFASKGLVVALYAASVTALSLLISFTASWSVGGALHSHSNLFEEMKDNFGHGFLSMIAGQVLVCLFFYSVGFIMRNSAATIVAYVVIFNFLGGVLKIVGAYLMLPVFSRVVSLLPDNAFVRLTSLHNSVCDYSGGVCGTGVIQTGNGESIPDLTWYQGGITLLIWTALAITAGMIVFKRRD